MTRNLLQQNSRFIACIALISIGLFTAGCNKQEQQPVVTPPVAKPVVAQAAMPIQKANSSSVKLAAPVTGNQFDFSSKKDPFKPLVVSKSATALSPDELKKAQLVALPIHSYDVSQFKLIGVVTGGKENQAMVVDPSGKGYVLKPGMTIGKNDGRIISINVTGVDVLEQFKDDNGRVRKENIRITLPRKQ